MATSKSVGSLAGLWRFPVKSMRGGKLEPIGADISLEAIGGLMLLTSPNRSHFGRSLVKFLT
jgi:hypothetical protein